MTKLSPCVHQEARILRIFVLQWGMAGVVFYSFFLGMAGCLLGFASGCAKA